MNNNKNDKANWFIDQLNLYQTANSDHNFIRDNFVIRKVEFSRIINSLIDKDSNDPLQCELILGRRGSGKSTLLKRIEIEILENKSLNRKYIPINLAEEQAGIYRLLDLWEQVIEELACQKSEQITIKHYSDFTNIQEYTRYLYQIIHNCCSKDNKKIVLLLDNFDRIIENFSDDGNLLRETLINYNDIAIIAASTRMDEYFWRYDMPFYEFFRRHRLEALNKHEISNLIQHWSKTLDLPELKTFEINNLGKIENIRILTDGLPRTLQFFIQMVLQNSNSTSYEYLNKIMDNVTPLYQERLTNLPAQLRKIVLEMAFIWEASNTKQLSEKCKMESKLISANLKTLVDKGIVDKIETSKKNHLYRLSERFFNLWLIVTQGNPEQKRKAKWLSIFIEKWYDSTDANDIDQKNITKLGTYQFNIVEKKNQLKESNQSNYLTSRESNHDIVSDDDDHNLAVLYYKQNLKKEDSLKYVRMYDKESASKIIIEIWNGIFNNIEQRSISLAKESIDYFDDFIFDLLVHQQKALVFRLFNNNDFGTELQNRFNILYYVNLIINNIEVDNVTLKIPPEIESIVYSLINQIDEKQKFYGYK
ncbi:MAG: hypothetical protein PHE56_03175 [Bacteroidales bacterium]|nr:hypothetical protein [Bacteroidales bacterium]